MSHTIRTASFVLILAAAYLPAAHAKTLHLCALHPSQTEALDAAVAKSVFDKIGVASGKADPIDLSVDDDDVKSTYQISELLRTRCDVFVGVPLSDKGDKPRHSVSAPYLDASFIKFKVKGGSPAASARGQVAVAFGSPGQLLAAQARIKTVEVENTQDQVIQAVVSGKTEYGIAWHPSLIGYQALHPEVKFDLAAINSDVARWSVNFVADASRSDLMAKISTALKQMQQSGELDRLAKQDLAQAAVAAQLAAAPASAGPAHVAVFTEAQAAAGKKLYADECASCHGAKLEGITAPGLVGSAFAPASGSTMQMGGIFQYMETNMPAQKPGQLKPEEYTALMAFLLQVNGYQGDGKELTTKGAEDNQAEFDSFVQ